MSIWKLHSKHFCLPAQWNLLSSPDPYYNRSRSCLSEFKDPTFEVTQKFITLWFIGSGSTWGLF